jgi:uncharacterized protein YjbI with pentapeptide repeats
LYSIKSYREKDLLGISLGGNDLTGWDFAGQDLSNASFFGECCVAATLADTNLAGANLNGADLTVWSLAGANLSGANLETVYHFFTNFTGALYNQWTIFSPEALIRQQRDSLSLTQLPVTSMELMDSPQRMWIF